MEIEEESFSCEVNNIVQTYLNLVTNNNITNELIYEEFAELFSCDVHIKNGLITKIWKKIFGYIWKNSFQSDKHCYFKLFEKCLINNEISNNLAYILLETILGKFCFIFNNY